MRYLKVFVLIIIFFISMVFFVQNTPELSREVILSLELMQFKLMSQPLPYYFLILTAFVLGACLCTIYFLADKIRLSRQLNSCRSKISNLEQEVNSLRNLPLDEKSYPAASENEDNS